MNLCECVSERAAILEHEAGIQREEAERLALQERRDRPLCDDCEEGELA